MALRRYYRVRSASRGPWWAQLQSDELLDLRFCDLGLTLRGTALQRCIDDLFAELRRAGLRFRPYVWLSTDWFTPDGVSGFAVPFYLAHPRLTRLELAQMSAVEGGTREWCMRLLRHEAGHAIDNAYRLRRRRRWREVFGPASAPYRDSYVPDPTSRRYVLNLDQWYAQSHPVEDFAETFAVWLRPGSRWRARYAGWGAEHKLRYVDELMRAIGDRPPPVRTRLREEPIAGETTTLREHYARTKASYEIDLATEHDRILRRVFSGPTPALRDSAAGFLRRHRAALRRRICLATRQDPYMIDQVLNEIVPRCRELDLRRVRSERRTLTDAALLLASATRRFVRDGNPRYTR